jgi:uncharacterized tellurite resistance protein B-like protein
MNVNTRAIRQLRDQLLSGTAAGGGDGMSSELLGRIEPFAETMFLVMGADDHQAEAEQQTLTAALNVLTGEALTGAELEALLARFRHDLEIFGREARLAIIGTRLGGARDDRETAFALAAAVALADHRVDVRETRLLELVREHFGISDRRVEAILAAMG